LPLTPKYDEKLHGTYLAALEHALDKPDASGIKNIALTGGYGVGKSSILEELVKRRRSKVVQVSMSTMGPVGDTQKSGGEEVKTNAIQKEIVKQLLYREEPTKMPGSRFRRIGRFKKWRGVALSTLVGVLLALVFYLAGWSAQLRELAPSVDLGLWLHLIVLAALTLTTFAILALLHNRVQIRQLKVADTDISLEKDAESSYFDQYLDEIVYFFEVTKRDIVIFEDIDRFNDAHIFETLRALNTLLNGAGQLNGRRRRRIRFIYAIKDSIFAELGRRGAKEEASGGNEAAAPVDLVTVEVERANRTKFFDLVIPVVPFITHRNARNLIDKTFAGIEHEIKPGLIDLAARHVTDMRLIKNLRNEFVVFRQKVTKSDDGHDLDLDDSPLFAMMLYKSTHLGDFEKIKSGQSDLDTLYSQFRDIVELARKRHTVEAQALRRQIADLRTVDGRSRELGDQLVGYAQRVRRHLGVADRAAVSVSLGGAERSEDELRAPDFWRDVAGSDGAVQVIFNDRGVPRGQFSIAKADLIGLFGQELSSAAVWDQALQSSLESKLAEVEKAREEVTYGDMDFLFEHEEFKDKDGKSFRELASSLRSELSQDLVAGGFLGRDFTLYTSTYYSGRVSTQAQNFLMRNITRKSMDIHCKLDAGDVDAIIKEQGDSVLREHGMYNISVFDHLLAPRGAGESDSDFAERDRRAGLLVRGLTQSGADQTQFLDAYLDGGGERGALVSELARRWSQVFEFLVKQTELDDGLQRELFNIALGSLESRKVTYLVKGNGVREYIEQHFAELDVLTDTTTDDQMAEAVVNLLAAAEVKVPSLSELGASVRIKIVASNAYRVTRASLELASGGKDIALDVLRGASETAYRYALSNLDLYLAALRQGDLDAATVSTSDGLASVVADIADKSPDALPEVLDGAVNGAEIASLASVPQAAWQHLAERSQFPATFGNVTAYIDAFSEIDLRLGAMLLSAKEITGTEGVDDAVLLELAAQVIAAQASIPDPSVRVALLESLRLPTWLPVGSVPNEAGPLIGLLVDCEVIEDDAQSFGLALSHDWPTREFAIGKSKEFADFMTATEVPVSDVAPLIASSAISNDVKDVVLARADEFVPTDHKNALTALAAHALGGGTVKKLPVELVTRMATAGVAADFLVPLLVPLLQDLDETQIGAILGALGGNYSGVSTRNGKRKKLHSSAPNLSVIERLEELEVVSSHTVDGQWIKVNMKKK